MAFPATLRAPVNHVPSRELEINTDALAALGIKRGSTVEVFDFNPRYTKPIYLILMPDDSYVVVKLCFCCDTTVTIKDVDYAVRDLNFIAAICEKPQLRLVK